MNKCKSNSEKQILNSQNISATETAGNASDAINSMNRQHRAYRIVIFGDEQERIHALTQIIAIRFVSLAINTGEEMGGKSTLNLRKNNSAKKATKNSKSVRSLTGKKTIK